MVVVAGLCAASWSASMYLLRAGSQAGGATSKVIQKSRAASSNSSCSCIVRSASRRTVQAVSSGPRLPDGVRSRSAFAKWSAPEKRNATSSVHRLPKKPAMKGRASSAISFKRDQSKCQGGGLLYRATRNSSMPAAVSSTGQAQTGRAERGLPAAVAGAAAAAVVNKDTGLAGMSSQRGRKLPNRGP